MRRGCRNWSKSGRGESSTFNKNKTNSVTENSKSERLEGGGAGFDELKKELAGLGEIEKKAGPRGQKKMRKLGSKKLNNSGVLPDAFDENHFYQNCWSRLTVGDCSVGFAWVFTTRRVCLRRERTTLSKFTATCSRHCGQCGHFYKNVSVLLPIIHHPPTTFFGLFSSFFVFSPPTSTPLICYTKTCLLPPVEASLERNHCCPRLGLTNLEQPFTRYVALGTHRTYLIDLIRRHSLVSIHLECDIESK